MAHENEQETARRSGLAYAAALALFFSIAAFLGVGWALDRWLGTQPWLLVAGIVVGSAIGFYQMVRLLSKIS
ncbi:MAG: AtpZ/AtpI family protein [Pyrinomonadaceae bacterium]